MSNKLFSPNKSLHVGREGFDLSKRVLFTSTTGQLLPIYNKLLEPGDHFEINVASLTRMQPMNTAAFARIDEHFDFFFVPCSDIWRFYNDWRMSIPDAPFSYKKSGDSALYDNVPSTLPKVAYSALFNKLVQLEGQGNDELGQKKVLGTQRLFSLLGYGTDNFFDHNEGRTHSDPTQEVGNTPVNIFPLLVYQKIYQDFYRNSQWENQDSASFNVDWFASSSNEYVFDSLPDNVCKLRYSNLKKDYFLGLSPSTQYGSVSVVLSGIDLVSPENVSGTTIYETPLSTAAGRQTILTTTSTSDSVARRLLSYTNILSVRQAEALQRWKEVYMLNGKRFKEQVKAMYGVDVPERRNRRTVFIDGFSNTMSIGEVVATASGDAGGDITTKSVLGQIAGKGMSATNNGNVIKFDNNDEFGYIMCIYHIEPRLDYEAYGIHPDLQMTDLEDFYNPAYDKIGLSPVRELALSSEGVTDNNIIGYGPRYLNYKTDFDVITGVFCNPFNNNMMKAWITPYDYARRQSYKDGSLFSFWDMKVSPHDLDNIMAVPFQGFTAIDDPFLVNCNFDIKAVRNMSANTLPY